VMGLTFNLINLKRKYGVDVSRVQKAHPIMVLGESYRNLLFGAALVMVLLFAIDPRLMAWFVPIPYLDRDGVRLLGVVVLVLAFGVVRLSHSQMGSSWRAGLDLAAPPTALVTTGIYARSRNPIYAGMIGTAFGLFLVLPNAVSLTIACLTLLLSQVRVQVEEEYLRKIHGATFADYCRRTPRWLLRSDRSPAE